MAEDEGKKEEEKFELDSAGEARAYISLDQARVLAMEHARDNRDFYGRRYASRELVWEVLSQEESEDYYDIRLSYRPTEGFRGEPGLEQFTIDKTGPIRLRQIISRPVEPRRRLGLPLALAGLAVVVAAAVAGVLFAAGVFSSTASQSPGLQPDAAVTVNIVAVIPDEPAQLVAAQGDVLVDVAPGSVATPVELRYLEVSSNQIPQLPAGYISAQRVFDLSLVPVEGQEERPVSLLQPITITVRLSTGDLSLAGGVASNVVIQHFDDGDSRWAPLPTTVDFTASTAQAQVDSLSIFALTIRQPEPTPTPLPTPITTPITPTPTPSPTSIQTPMPAPTPTSTAVPTATPVPTPMPSPTSTPLPTPAFAPTPTATPLPTPTPTPTPVPRYFLVTGLDPENLGLGSIQVLPPSEGQEYSAGTVALITVTCMTTFVGWAGDVPSNASSASNPLSVIMDRNRDLIASCATPAPPPTATPRPTPIPGSTPTPFFNPAITLSPAASFLGDPVTATGTGFPPLNTVTIVYQLQDDVGIEVATVVPDSGGRFSVMFNVPSKASDDTSNVVVATAFFRSARKVHQVLPASLEFVPPQVSPGSTFEISGMGFRPNSTLTSLTIDQTDILPSLPPITDNRGTFVLTLFLATRPPGEVELSAAVDDIAASAFLTVSGPVTTIPTPIPTATPIPAPVITLNVIPNPSFEAGVLSPDGWSLSSEFIGWASEVAHTGERSIRWRFPIVQSTFPNNCAPRSGGTILSEPIAIDRAITYEFSWWVMRSATANASSITAQLMYLDSLGDRLSGGAPPTGMGQLAEEIWAFASQMIGPDGNWQWPNGTESVRVLMSHGFSEIDPDDRNCSGEFIELWVDDVFLRAILGDTG